MSEGGGTRREQKERRLVANINIHSQKKYLNMISNP